MVSCDPTSFTNTINHYISNTLNTLCKRHLYTSWAMYKNLYMIMTGFKSEKMCKLATC